MNGMAHEGHDHGDAAETSTESAAAFDPTAPTNKFQANGKTYRWEHRADLGKQSEDMFNAAKGGLHNNADRDLLTGEIVTVVAKHGLVTLDPKLKEWTLVDDQDAVFSGGMNAHGTDCFVLDGESHWAFASTNTQQVFVTKRGKVLATLSQPKGDEFDNPTVNEYFQAGGRFTPCDVVFLPEAKRLVVVIGYAPGDFALSAELVDGQWQWGGPAWGGREGNGGMLNTGHGVQIATEGGREIVEIASRSHGRIFSFTPNGAQIRTPGADKDYFIQLPKGSNPCNLFNVGDNMFLPLLNSLPKTNGSAPVLVLENGKPAGALVPATYDTLNLMQHMHGFCPVEIDGKLFGIVLSWRNGGENANGKPNDGQIAIFEAVEE
ncbi:putative signal peptide and transmembrane protein [Rhodopirellula islandica]|uniref:Signal peptide and transmembrane protein n=2 Tax=Rhodopirellula islandica TaxID=595434 RepID=A0A0J1B4E2_RHOIS|nr:putative signal peptide and transmembrane protein [Rhodopirellula islandica]